MSDKRPEAAGEGPPMVEDLWSDLTADVMHAIVTRELSVRDYVCLGMTNRAHAGHLFSEAGAASYIGGRPDVCIARAPTSRDSNVKEEEEKEEGEDTLATCLPSRWRTVLQVTQRSARLLEITRILGLFLVRVAALRPDEGDQDRGSYGDYGDDDDDNDDDDDTDDVNGKCVNVHRAVDALRHSLALTVQDRDDFARRWRSQHGLPPVVVGQEIESDGQGHNNDHHHHHLDAFHFGQSMALPIAGVSRYGNARAFVSPRCHVRPMALKEQAVTVRLRQLFADAVRARIPLAMGRIAEAGALLTRCACLAPMAQRLTSPHALDAKCIDMLERTIGSRMSAFFKEDLVDDGADGGLREGEGDSPTGRTLGASQLAAQPGGMGRCLVVVPVPSPSIAGLSRIGRIPTGDDEARPHPPTDRRGGQIDDEGHSSSDDSGNIPETHPDDDGAEANAHPTHTAGAPSAQLHHPVVVAHDARQDPDSVHIWPPESALDPEGPSPRTEDVSSMRRFASLGRPISPTEHSEPDKRRTAGQRDASVLGNQPVVLAVRVHNEWGLCPFFTATRCDARPCGYDPACRIALIKPAGTEPPAAESPGDATAMLGVHCNAIATLGAALWNSPVLSPGAFGLAGVAWESHSWHSPDEGHLDTVRPEDCVITVNGNDDDDDDDDDDNNDGDGICSADGTVEGENARPGTKRADRAKVGGTWRPSLYLRYHRVKHGTSPRHATDDSTTALHMLFGMAALDESVSLSADDVRFAFGEVIVSRVVARRGGALAEAAARVLAEICMMGQGVARSDRAVRPFDVARPDVMSDLVDLCQDMARAGAGVDPTAVPFGRVILGGTAVDRCVTAFLCDAFAPRGSASDLEPSAMTRARLAARLGDPAMDGRRYWHSLLPPLSSGRRPSPGEEARALCSVLLFYAVCRELAGRIGDLGDPGPQLHIETAHLPLACSLMRLDVRPGHTRAPCHTAKHQCCAMLLGMIGGRVHFHRGCPTASQLATAQARALALRRSLHPGWWTWMTKPAFLLYECVSRSQKAATRTRSASNVSTCERDAALFELGRIASELVAIVAVSRAAAEDGDRVAPALARLAVDALQVIAAMHADG